MNREHKDLFSKFKTDNPGSKIEPGEWMTKMIETQNILKDIKVLLSTIDPLFLPTINLSDLKELQLRVGNLNPKLEETITNKETTRDEISIKI